MAGTNQYFSFSAAVGANALTYSAWSALTTLRANGFTTGVASSEQVNTLMRQMSVPTSGLAQFVANQDVNVLDDGSSSNFAAAVLAAAKKVAREYGTPVGTVVTGLWRTDPTGYVEVKGQWLSRTTYADLWAYVQDLATTYPALLITDAAWAAGGVGVRVAFSTGDGSTTFRMPDYRGLHPRYWEGARSSPSVDAGRTLGSYQADELLAHTHTLAFGSTSDSGVYAVNDSTPVTTTNTGSTGGAENRVKNVALRVCMKY